MTIEEKKEYHRQKSKEYREKNKQATLDYWKTYYAENRDKKLEYEKKYREINSDKITEYHKKYSEKRRKTDDLFDFKERVRNLIKNSFDRKKLKKINKTAEILGCDFEFFKGYIEAKFKDGMTWENRSKWHLDHIIPLMLAETKEEVIKLCHYTNFQPLWGTDNLTKNGYDFDKELAEQILGRAIL